MIKCAVYQSARSDLRTSLDLISSHMGIVQSMEESHETFNAFREKRAPKLRRPLICKPSALSVRLFRC